MAEMEKRKKTTTISTTWCYSHSCLPFTFVALMAAPTGFCIQTPSILDRQKARHTHSNAVDDAVVVAVVIFAIVLLLLAYAIFYSYGRYAAFNVYSVRCSSC